MIDKRLIREIPNKTIYYAGMGGRAFALSLFAVSQSVLLAMCVDRVFLKKIDLKDILPLLITLVAVFTLRPVLTAYHDYAAKKTAVSVKKQLRKKLADFVELDSGRLVTHSKTGELSTLAVEGVESVDAYFSEFMPQLFLVGINTLVVLVFVATQDTLSALIMMITAPLIPVFMILIGKTADGISKRQWETLKSMNGHLLDMLRGMVTLRHFNKHLSQSQSVERMSENFRRATLKVLRISFLSAFTLELLATLSTAVVAVSLGLRLLYGWMEFLPALTVLLLAPEFFQPLRILGQKFHAGMNGKIAADQFDPLLQERSDLMSASDYCEEKVLPLNSWHPNQESPILTAENLSFSYNDTDAVLENLNFAIFAGEAVAITGPSGIGKTTLLRLLIGAQKKYKGKLTLDGCELSQWYGSSELFKIFSYVPQTSKIFRGSVMDNLTFGRPEVPREEVMAIAMQIGFHAVAEKLPQGYDTPIGEGASQLSGGEAQLLSITRAYLRQTPIILMDEPTSAMDVQTEHLLTQAMILLRKNRTLLIAAHRKRTIALCDRELCLNDRGGAQ